MLNANAQATAAGSCDFCEHEHAVGECSALCHFRCLGQSAWGCPKFSDEFVNAAFERKKADLYALLYDKVAKYNGSISAEHGIGQTKRAQLAKVKQPEVLAVMHAIKASFDPKNLMNPGKIL